MPRTKHIEPSSSESEEFSESESGASPVVAPKSHKRKAKPATPPKEKRAKKRVAEPESDSESDSEDVHSLDELKKMAQAKYDKAYAKGVKAGDDKKKGLLPKGTHLFLEARNDITGEATNELMVLSRDNTMANMHALEAGRKLLLDLGYFAEFRVPYNKPK